MRPSRGLFVAVSIGAWGGVYCYGGRLCLGWVAVTVGGRELDDVLQAGLDRLEGR